MHRYFINISFDGADYHGWQIQPNGNSVQEELQNALSLLLRQNIEIVGAGRTDAGVNAKVMYAHFDFHDALDCEQTAYRLNRILPKDISVNGIKETDCNMHARFSAKKRTYRYFVHTKKNPFQRKYSLELHYKLDFELMNKACSMLLEHSDFKAFCKTGSDAKTTICNIYSACWVKTDNDCWYFEISADRFLRNMVRAIVGTLIEVGRKRLSLEKFCDLLNGGTRSDAGESVVGNALFLWNVEY